MKSVTEDHTSKIKHGNCYIFYLIIATSVQEQIYFWKRVFHKT